LRKTETTIKVELMKLGTKLSWQSDLDMPKTEL